MNDHEISKILIHIHIEFILYKTNMTRKSDESSFTSCVIQLEGAVKFSHYDVQTFTSLDELFSDSKYPNNPWLTGTLISFEAAKNVIDNYCIRMQALFVAPANGQYIFSARSDDYSKTFLSTDHTENNKQMMIDIPQYVLPE